MAVSTSTWISFFKEAGIPAGVAATYALTFYDNRIQMDMLLELNKEYLRDMGITLMGDVIAILRHAKRVHEQTAREKILGHNSLRTVNVGASQALESTNVEAIKTTRTVPVNAAQKKVTPASRILEHYIRKTDSKGPLIQVVRISGRSGTFPDKNCGVASQANMSPIAIRKKVVKTKLPISSELSEDATAAKKIRRVLPEHEGRYKITMPSGSTPRTKEILAKMKSGPVSSPKKTVFDRLGSDGIVTSTTELESPRITITGLGNDIIKTGNEKPSSVFLRLGEKSQVPSSTTVSAPEKRINEEVTHNSDTDKTLPYVGILKSRPKFLKTVPTKREAPTMHADKELSGGVINKFRPQFNNNNANREIKNVLRLTKPTGFLGNHVNNCKTSVKARLGSVRADTSFKTFTTTSKESFSTPPGDPTDNSAKKRVTFGGVSSVYPTELEQQPNFSRFRSDYNPNRGPRGGVFNRLSL